jgi:hypothetical protein
VNLRSVDLNLVVVLDALLQELHVTRAADCVGLSQPAMSNALARLRHIFKDELLVRTATGMQGAGTERADAPAGGVGTAGGLGVGDLQHPVPGCRSRPRADARGNCREAGGCRSKGCESCWRSPIARSY